MANIDLQKIYYDLQQSEQELSEGTADIKTSIISDGVYALEVVLADSVRVLLSSHSKDLKEAMAGIKAIKKRYDQLKAKTDKEIKELKSLREKELKKYNEAIKENELYKSRYGTLVHPDDLVIEFWNNGNVGEYGLLIPPSRWKLKLYGENGIRAKRYWISVFKKIGILEVWSSKKYRAKVGLQTALDMLHAYQQKENGLKSDINNIKETV